MYFFVSTEYDASYLHSSCVNLIKSYNHHKSQVMKEKEKSQMTGPDFELKNVEISKTSLVETINQDNKNSSI